jgi:hypothetical protein
MQNFNSCFDKKVDEFNVNGEKCQKDMESRHERELDAARQ